MNGEPRNIIFYWRLNDWGKYGRRSEMIARELANRSDVRKIIYFEPPVSPYNIESKFKILKLMPIHWKKQTDKLTIFQTVDYSKLIGPNKHFLSLVNHYFVIAIIRLLLLIYGFKNPLLWICPPDRFGNLLSRKVRYSQLVCDCVDDVTSPSYLTVRKKKQLESLYAEILSKADTVFATSESLAKRMKRYARESHFIPNASDMALFKNVRNQNIHKFHNNSKRIVAGYIGVISERTDIQLLQYIAAQKPSWEFHLIGPIHKDCDVSKLKKYDNIQFKGAFQYHRLPEAVSHFDVCLLPHKDNAFSKSMSPLKLFQYFSTGLPIVSTRIDAIKPYEDLIFVANTYEDFIQHIEDAYQKDSHEKRSQRINTAIQNSWESRVNKMWCKI